MRKDISIQVSIENPCIQQLSPFIMKISTVSCKSALTPSRLGGYDYALNPYRGCQHGCTYCYAPYVLREKRRWGCFVEARDNLPRLLSKELRRKAKGVVGISTVTDAYQPAEKRFEITRLALEQLQRYDFPVCIQTKSSLVLRDLDLLQGFSKCEVGFTVTTLDEDIRQKIEPGASTVGERLAALETLADAGVSTWAFLGPILPSITDGEDDLRSLISALKKTGVSYLIVDRLNFKQGMRPDFIDFIAREFPEQLNIYRQPLKGSFDTAKKEVTRFCRDADLKVEFCY